MTIKELVERWREHARETEGEGLAFEALAWEDAADQLEAWAKAAVTEWLKYKRGDLDDMTGESISETLWPAEQGEAHAKT